MFVFSEEISNAPIQIGDYVINGNLDIGVVINKLYDYYTIYIVEEKDFQEFHANELIQISDKLFHFLTQHKLGDIIKKNIIDYVYCEFEREDVYFYDLPVLHRFITLLDCIFDVFYGEPSFKMQYCLFHNNIKKITKHKNEKNLRIIELNNGSQWIVKRIKNKTKTILNQARKQYKKYKKVKNKTVHYQIIEKIKW